MPAPQQTLNIIQQERQRVPSRYKDWSDERIYRLLNARNLIPNNAKWDEATETPESKISTPDDLSFIGAISDWGINEESYDWMKAAYNRSLAGTTEQLVYGESRYDVDEADFTILQDIGASIVSFFMPLDIMTMGVGGKIGGYAAKSAVKSGLFGGALKKASQEAVEAGAKDIFQDRAVAKVLSNNKLQKALIGGVQQAPALGLYESAIYGVQSKIEGESFWEGAAEGALHGGFMGFATGMIGGGMGAKQAEILSKGKEPGKFLSKMDKIKGYGVYGMPGQIGAEATFFSGAELAPKVLKGEDVRGEEILHTFARNVGLFTGLKTIGKLQNKFWQEAEKVFDEIPSEKAKKDKTDIAMDNANRSYEEVVGQKSEALAREKSKMTEQDIVDRAIGESMRKNIRNILDIKRSGDPTKIDGVEVARINYTLAEVIARIERGEITPAREQILKQAKAEKEILEKEFKDWVDSSSKKDVDAPKESPLTPPDVDSRLKPSVPKKDKPLKDMAESELVKEGVNVLNKNAEQINKDYGSGIIDPKTGNQLLSKDRLIKDIKAKKQEKYDMELGPEIIHPKEHYFKKEKQEGIPQKFDVMNKVAGITNKLIEEGITPNKYNKMGDKNLKESYYDIHDIGQNTFASESRVSKSKDPKTGERRLVETSQDIKYIEIYKKLAKELAKDKKSLRDATKDDVLRFISNKENKGSQDAIKILYDNLNAAGKLRQASLITFVPEIQKFSGIAERVDKGLRMDRIDLEAGEVRYVQSKTLGVKEVPLGTRLKELFSKILGKIKKDDVAGDTVFRDVNGKGLTKTQQTNLIKKFFGEGVNNSDLRKAFSQYVANKYSMDSPQWALVNELGLGHTKPKIEVAYTKAAGRLKSDLIALQKEFVNFIEGKEALPLKYIEAYPKGQGVNIQKLRDAYNKIKAERATNETGEIRVKNSTISLDTAEAMIRYMVEASPRPGETVPQKPGEIIFKRFIPEWAKEGQTQYQVNKFREKLDATIAEQKTYKEYFEKIPQYKELEIQLGKDLGKVGGKKVLGQIEGHIIKIAKGNVKSDTIPHEVSHYVVNVLKQFGTNKSKSLIKRGVKMFGDEEKLVQRIGEYAQGMIKDKSLIAKAKNWVKTFNSQLKEFFGLATKEDIAFIMSRKVVKGDIPINVKIKNYINKMSKDYQFADEAPKESGPLYGYIKSSEKTIRDKGILNQAEINEARRKFGIPLEGEGRGRASIGEMNAYGEYIYNAKVRAKDYTSRLEDLRLENNITLAESKKIARALGSLDGKIEGLTAKNKALYEEIVTQYSKKEQVIPSASDHIDGLKGDLTFHQKIARVVLPAYEFIGKYGGKAGRDLKDKIVYFDTFNTRLRGEGYDGARLIKEKLGKDRYKTFTKNSSLLDTKRIEAYLKAFEKTKDGKDGVAVKEGWKSLSDAEITFYKNTLKKGTVEYDAKKIWESTRSYYWNKLKNEARKINNQAEFEKFEREFNDKFVNDYFTRRLTKDAYKYLIENNKIDKIVQSNLEKAAQIKAKEKAGPNASKERIKELTDKYKKDKNLETEVYSDIYHFFKQDHKEIKNRFLKERGPILPEFMIIKNAKTGQNKLVRTYEKSFQGTIDAYIMGMSKHIATVRYFPDYSGMGGKYKIGKTPADLVRLAGKDRFLKEYAEKTIENLVGIGEMSPLHKEGFSFLSTVAHVSAFSGLSSPTSGIKNILIGIPRSIASYGFFNTARGVAKLFNVNTWNEARSKGALEYGARTLELGKTKKIFGKNMEDVFRWNLMTKTENINRIVSMEAGKLYFQSQIGALQGRGLMGKMGTKNAKRLMRDMWQLSEKDIKFLEKMDITNKNNAFKFNEILAHIEQTSHIAAQGGTSVGRLPLWMSSKYGKPLTLFQRMAYSTTYDSVKNYYIPAFKNGNFAPLARAVTAHTVSGIALYGLYKTLFDTEPPKSADKGLDKMTMYLWRSEFLGLGGELLSPYEGENSGMFQSLTQPVIVRNLSEAGKQFNRWYHGEEFAGKAASNFFKKSLVAYNQFETMRKVSTSKDYANARKINNWESQFKKTYETQTRSKDMWAKRSPYYRDLKEALFAGEEGEMAKTFYAAYNYIVTDLEKKYSNAGIYRHWSQNHKEAISSLKTSLKSMKPGDVFSESAKGASTSLKAQFKKWVQSNFGNEGNYLLRQAQSHYEDMLKELNKISGKYWDKYSVYGGSKSKNTRI